MLSEIFFIKNIYIQYLILVQDQRIIYLQIGRHVWKITENIFVKPTKNKNAIQL